jgi:hypothetical protein
VIGSQQLKSCATMSIAQISGAGGNFARVWIKQNLNLDKTL